MAYISEGASCMRERGLMTKIFFPFGAAAIILIHHVLHGMILVPG